MKFVSNVGFRDWVTIDGDASLRVVVTAIMFREGVTLVECCWMANGERKEARIEEWRLTPCEE